MRSRSGYFFLIVFLFAVTWIFSPLAEARKSRSNNSSWWTNWWLACQRSGSCQHNGRQYYYDADRRKVLPGRAIASTAPAMDSKENDEETPDFEAERATAERNRARDPGEGAELPPPNSNCAREIRKSQAALAKYNKCLQKKKLPPIVWGISGTGFLVDGSRPGRQKKMFAIRDGKCLYEQTVSLGRGSDTGINGTAPGSKRTPAGLFGLSYNTRRGSRFFKRSLVLHGGNAANRGILIHNGSTANNSIGCIRLGGGIRSSGGNFTRVHRTFNTGVNNMFIFFENAKAPNGGCGTPKNIEPAVDAHTIAADTMGVGR